MSNVKRQNMSRKPEPLRVSPGVILRRYTDSELAAWLSQWLEVFGGNRHGVNSKDYLWHIFSGGRYPSLRGAEALTEYISQRAPEYVVLSNSRDIAFETDVLPETCSLSDFFVSPRNLAWSMAFTHEDGWLGPYFARHGNFATLSEANLKRLQKAEEAETAKLKGWR